jgi:hypothetical protein
MYIRAYDAIVLKSAMRAKKVHRHRQAENSLLSLATSLEKGFKSRGANSTKKKVANPPYCEFYGTFVFLTTTKS